jgi:hypothetical protein
VPSGSAEYPLGGKVGEVLHIPVAHHVGERSVLHHSQHQSDAEDHAAAR